MRILLFALVLGLALNLALAKKDKSTEKENKNVDSNMKKPSKPKVEAKKSAKGSKKQFLGYPEPDGRQTMAQGPFGQGLPGYGGGMRSGGMGSEMEGMPVGIGGGGEPLGFRDQDNQNVHVPGIANRPSNYDDNAEVGRDDGEDNGYANRFSKQNDLDYMSQGALSRMNGLDQDSNYSDREREPEEDEQPDSLVTKAIGRPFEPENEQEEQMENHEDSPFQQVKQESPFQVPLNSLAAQVNFANQQMSPIRPGYEGPLGQQQIERPSGQLQPPGEDNGEEQGYGPQENSKFRATSMTGGEFLMGMNDQEGVKRHQLLNKGKKFHQKVIKRKRISHEKKGKHEKSKN